MHPSLFDREEPISLMPGVFIAAISIATWVSRKGLTYLRPWGASEKESLMNCSRLGSLQCHCVPTDAAVQQDDRRKSCRACGNAIVSYDPARLYAELSVTQIKSLAEGARRRAIDEARHASPLPVGEYADGYAHPQVH